MANYTIKKGTSKENLHGTWWKHGKGVTVKCPTCGCIGNLDHDVSSEGVVSPSLDCPKCIFHEFVILEGWDEEARVRQGGDDVTAD